MAALNGTSLLVYIDSTPIGATRSHTLSVEDSLIDVTTKDSLGWAENLNGLRSWSISFDGLYDPAKALNATEILTAITGRELLDVTFTTDVTGEAVWSGQVRVASMEINADMEAEVTLSGELTGTGALTEGVVPA